MEHRNLGIMEYWNDGITPKSANDKIQISNLNELDQWNKLNQLTGFFFWQCGEDGEAEELVNVLTGPEYGIDEFDQKGHCYPGEKAQETPDQDIQPFLGLDWL